MATESCRGREQELPLSIIDKVENDLTLMEAEHPEELDAIFGNKFQHVDREHCVGVIAHQVAKSLIGLVLSTASNGV